MGHKILWMHPAQFTSMTGRAVKHLGHLSTKGLSTTSPQRRHVLFSACNVSARDLVLEFTFPISFPLHHQVGDDTSDDEGCKPCAEPDDHTDLQTAFFNHDYDRCDTRNEQRYDYKGNGNL